MESAHYLIIGGGVAGTTAATTIRQHDTENSIAIINQEPYPLYSRTTLVEYMAGKVSQQGMILRDESYYQSKNITLHTNRQAVDLDPKAKTVILDDGSIVNYQKLLVATGGQPRKWSAPGSQLPGVYALRTLDQASKISQYIKKSKHVIVVGGGFITLELIQLLSRVGVATTVVLRGPHYWSDSLDEESGKLIDSYILEAPNVTVLYNTAVDEVVGTSSVSSVILSNGRKLNTDLVLANIGLEYDTDWLKRAGLTIERGIVVNEQLQTDDPHIFAAGDIALFYDPLINLYHQHGNWNNALLQGQVAGQNMVGHTAYMEAVTSYTIQVFGRPITFLGQTAKRASMTVLPRGSARSGAYGRILIKNNRVVGATLVNRDEDKEPISRLISSQVDISRYKIELTDESISLQDLSSHLSI